MAFDGRYMVFWPFLPHSMVFLGTELRLHLHVLEQLEQLWPARPVVLLLGRLPASMGF